MKLTFIIPIFNAQSHLENCLESILNTSVQNFEVILINDGSTDNSGEICEKYALLDHRVKYIEQENQGVSVARNVGLEYSKGYWISFVDSDDYISQDYAEPIELVNNEDWILVNAQLIQGGQIQKFLTYENKSYDTTEFLRKFKIYSDFSTPWAKFYKSSIIKTHNLTYDKNLKIGGDTIFNLQYLQHCKEIKTSNLATYFYREHNSGLTGQTSKYQLFKELYIKFHQELSNYSFPLIAHNMHGHPLSTLLTFLYRDKKLNYTFRKKEIEWLLACESTTMQEALKKSRTKEIFGVFLSIRLYRLLDTILKLKFR